jgi:hypothetical protein
MKLDLLFGMPVLKDDNFIEWTCIGCNSKLRIDNENFRFKLGGIKTKMVAFIKKHNSHVT